MSAVLLNGQLWENGELVVNDKETLGYRKDKNTLVSMLHEAGGDWDRVPTAGEEEAWQREPANADLVAMCGTLQAWSEEVRSSYWQSSNSRVRHFFYEANQELLARGKEELALLSGEDRRAALLRYARKTLNEDMETQLKILIEKYPAED